MKLLVMPKSLESLTKMINNIDGAIIGLDGLCINMPYKFSYDELISIINYLKDNNKEVFVALNKNIHDSELDYLRDILLKLDKLNINGILYYDISIVNLKSELGLKTDLVWAQEHLATNYLTSNFWYEYGAKYMLISSDITLREVNEIADNSKCKTMFMAFGYLPMFVSRRHLVKNYLDTFNIEDNSKINYISKEGSIYPIIDSKEGTISYSSKIFSSLEELDKIKTDYIILNSFNINDDDFIKVVDLYKNNGKEEEINKMFDIYKGFLYNETIYKVK